MTKPFECATVCSVAMEHVTIEVKDILSPGKAAKYLGTNRMTLWRWVKENKITPVMLDHTYFHIGELNRVKALIEKGVMGKRGDKK